MKICLSAINKLSMMMIYVRIDLLEMCVHYACVSTQIERQREKKNWRTNRLSETIVDNLSCVLNCNWFTFHFNEENKLQAYPDSSRHKSSRERNKERMKIRKTNFNRKRKISRLFFLFIFCFIFVFIFVPKWNTSFWSVCRHN